MKKTLLILAAIMMITISCDKNQKAVKLLNGKWKLTSTKSINVESGNEVTTAASEDDIIELDFDNCKLKDNEFCTITSIFTEDGKDPQYGVSVYRISGDGTTLETGASKYDEELSSSEIVSLDDTQLVVKTVDEEDENLQTEATYEKQ